MQGLQWLKNPNVKDRLAGVGQVLMAMDQGRAVDLSPLRERIQSRQQNQSMMDRLQDLSPDQRQTLTALPPKAAQRWLIDRFFRDLNASPAGGGGQAPGLPQYRYGTNFHPGGKAVVGENGPEVVDLPRGAKVQPNPKDLAFFDMVEDAISRAEMSPSVPSDVAVPSTIGQVDPYGTDYNAVGARSYTPQGQPVAPRAMPSNMPNAPEIQGDAYDPNLMPGDGADPRGMFWQEDSQFRLAPGGNFAAGKEYRTADMSGIAPSGVGETNALNAAARSFQGFMKSLADYETTFAEGGSTAWPGKRRDELSIAHRDLQMQMKELYNLGVLNGPDLSLMNQILIDPTSIVGNAMDVLGGGKDMEKRIPANIQQVRQLMVNRTTPALQQLGIDPQQLMPAQEDDAAFLKRLGLE